MNTVKEQFKITEDEALHYGLSPEEFHLALRNVWVTEKGEVFSKRNGTLKKLKQSYINHYKYVVLTEGTYSVHRLMRMANIIDSRLIYINHQDTDMQTHHREKVRSGYCNNRVDNLELVPSKYHYLYDTVDDVIVIDDCSWEHMEIISALINMKLSVKSFKYIVKNCEPYKEYNGYHFYRIENMKRELHFAVKFK